MRKMSILIILRALFLYCVPLVFFFGLSCADEMSAAAICKKVAETYRTLRVCQLVAQQSFDLPGSASLSFDAIYTLAMVKPGKIRLTLKGAPPIPWEQRLRFHLDN